MSGQPFTSGGAISRRTLLLGMASVVVGCGAPDDAARPAPTDNSHAAVERIPTFGSSAFSPPGPEDYERMVGLLGIRSAFVYQPQEASWNDLCRAVSPDHDIWLSVSTTNIDQLLNEMPTDRLGRVFLHYQQEPHDNMTYTTWATASRTIFAKAAQHSCVVPSAEFSAYAFLNHPNGRWFLDEVECYGFSSFADIRIEDGHVVAQTNPAEQLARVAGWAEEVGKSWSVAACGFGIPPALVGDPASHENRLRWAAAQMSQARQLGALHYQWFNVLWQGAEGPLDYRIEGDPDLHGLWRERSSA